AAEKADFVIAGIGPGVLQRLVDHLGPPLRLLRVTGEEHVPLAPPPGIAVVTRIAYRSEPLPLPKAMADRLEGGGLDRLHSAAEKADFVIAGIGPGVLQRLVDHLGPPLRLLRVTGEEHVPLAPPPGIEVVTRIAYRSEPLPLPKAMADRLEGGALVLLHSAAAARHFATECDRLAVPRGALRLATLGPRIAAAAGEGWGEVRAAASADEAALLALARDMCHEPRGPDPQG